MITREVEATAVADLAYAPPRASLATTVENEILLLPISLTLEDPTDPGFSPRVLLVPKDCPDLAGQSVVVVADDGPQWFRLRSLTVRGTAVAMGGGSYRLVPRRVVAWDYGSLRPAPAPPESGRPQQPDFSVVDRNDVQPVSSSELEAALAASRVMIIATRSPKGTPFAVPLWFVAHHGSIWATTGASSWTVRNVVASPDVAILLGGENRNDTRMLVRGRARAVPGIPPAAVLARIAWRYYLDPPFAAVELINMRLWCRRVRYYAQSKGAQVIVIPQSAAECLAPQ